MRISLAERATATFAIAGFAPERRGPPRAGRRPACANGGDAKQLID